MKKAILTGVIITFLFILTVIIGVASAGTIVGSKHDFSAPSPNNPLGGGSQWSGLFYANGQLITEICIFCHTPHNASTDSAHGLNTLLWNRAEGAVTGFTPYTSPTQTTTFGNPTGISLMCMSCHDGVTSIAVGSLIDTGPGNPVVTYDGSLGTNGDKIGTLFYPGGSLGVGPNIGDTNPGGGVTQVNMSNDHPVSFDWPGWDTGIQLPTDPRVRLFGPTKKMECASCHTVHDPTNRPFLAMPNDGSALCLQCHKK